MDFDLFVNCAKLLYNMEVSWTPHDRTAVQLGLPVALPDARV